MYLYSKVEARSVYINPISGAYVLCVYIVVTV